MPRPLDRTGESEKALRARLIYQTRKRGTLESDLLLSTFARDFLDTMSVEELQLFDKVSLASFACSSRASAAMGQLASGPARRCRATRRPSLFDSEQRCRTP